MPSTANERSLLVPRMLLTTILVISAVLAVQRLGAQEVSGWTSLEWDPSSQTLTGNAETDLDDYAAAYYAAALNTYLFDSNGNTLAYAISNRNTNESWVDLTLSAHGTPGQTYSQHSEHLAVAQYSSDCALPCRGGGVYYDDFYNYTSFSGDTTVYDGQVELFGPGPPIQTRSSAPHLPPTFSNATANARSLCGDSRDQMISDYLLEKVDLTPVCSNFTSSARSSHFSFAQLNVNNSYPFALLTNVLLSRSDEWWSNYTPTYGPMVVNSAYREPAHNGAIGGAHNSRHMHGDAVDMNNPTKDLTGRNNLISATYDLAPSYIEPTTLACKLLCVHIDFRGYSETFMP